MRRLHGYILLLGRIEKTALYRICQSRQHHYPLPVSQEVGHHFHIVLWPHTAGFSSAQGVSGITVGANILFVRRADHREKLVTVFQAGHLLMVQLYIAIEIVTVECHISPL